jgi:hypothetical protein
VVGYLTSQVFVAPFNPQAKAQSPWSDWQNDTYRGTSVSLAVGGGGVLSGDIQQLKFWNSNSSWIGNFHMEKAQK